MMFIFLILGVILLCFSKFFLRLSGKFAIMVGCYLYRRKFPVAILAGGLALLGVSYIVNKYTDEEEITDKVGYVLGILEALGGFALEIGPNL